MLILQSKDKAQKHNHIYASGGLDLGGVILFILDLFGGHTSEMESVGGGHTFVFQIFDRKNIFHSIMHKIY